MTATQDELFDTLAFVGGNTRGQASARNLIGTTAAEIAVRALGAITLHIDGRKTVCPDFRLGAFEGEIKSCRMKYRRAVMYKYRVEKEAAYCDPQRYLYVFVSHRASAKAVNRDEVVRAFTQGIDVHCCTLAEVQRCLAGKRLRTIAIPEQANLRVGYYRTGYSNGFYLLPFSQIGWPHLAIHKTVNIAEAQAPCRIYISEGWNQTIKP